MKSDLPLRTFEFAKEVVRLCQHLDCSPGVPRTLANQLLRSGTSIGANVEEGQASQSAADFVSKYSIACKEALLDTARIKPHLDECNELIAILTSIVIKMKAKKNKV
jgi:four helix bundle protein